MGRLRQPMTASRDGHAWFLRLAAAAAMTGLGVVIAWIAVIRTERAGLRRVPAVQLAPPASPLAAAPPGAPCDEGPPGLTSAEVLERARDRDRAAALIIDHRQPAPGRRHLLAIWTDPAAAAAFREERRPHLPVGTLVQKGRQGTGWTVAMLQREPGYAPDAGDWEFLEYDIGDGRMLQRGRIPSCLACHGSCVGQGLLFRTYLPAFAGTPVPRLDRPAQR